MWWLEDGRFRGNFGDERGIVIRGGIVVSRQALRKRRKLDLTAAQIAANRSLLESEPEPEPSRQQLLDDIASLENAIRTQISERRKIEASQRTESLKYQQQIAALAQSQRQASEQAEIEHAKQLRAVADQLAQAEQSCRRRESQNVALQRHNRRLRESLAAAEMQIRGLSDELSELQTLDESRSHQWLQRLAEAEHQHTAESNHLRAIASSAEQRASKRRKEVEQLASALREQKEQVKHREIELAQRDRRIDEECQRTQARDEMLGKLATDLHQRDETIGRLNNELQSRDSRLAQLSSELQRRDQSIRQLEKARGEGEATVRRLTAELSEQCIAVDQLTADLRDRHTITGQLGAELQSQQGLVKRMQDEMGQLATTHQDALEYLGRRHQEELDTLRAELRNSQQQSATEIDRLYAELDRRGAEKAALVVRLGQAMDQQREQQQTIIRLEQQCETAESRAEHCHAEAEQHAARVTELESTIDQWKEKWAALLAEHREEKAGLEKQITRLRENLGHNQRQVADQSRHADEVARLRVTVEHWRTRLQQLEDEQSTMQAQHARSMSDVQARLRASDDELDSLGREAEAIRHELDQKNGALERLQSTSEQVLAEKDARHRSLQSRVDELAEALKLEKRKRDHAESEARRLSNRRSGRLAFLNSQRSRLTDEITRLKSELGRRQASEAKIRATTGALEFALRDAEAMIAARQQEIRWLWSQVHHQRNVMATQKHDAEAEISRLATQAERSNERLAKCQQELESQACMNEFGIAQRDRTIAMLEKDAQQMQKRLQLEAAARRKAEGAIKRRAVAGSLDSAAEKAWSQIDVRERIQRLHRQIAALQNLNLFERQRAQAKIARYKDEIARLKRKPRKAA